MSRKLIIFGNNAFAEMVAHYFEDEAQREVVAFTAHERFLGPAQQPGAKPLIPFEKIADEFAPAEHEIFVALEHGRQNAGRADVIAEAKAKGFEPASFISPAARVSSNARIGEHCLVLEGAVIQHGAVLGDNNLIFANSFFGQSCTVGAHNYFGSAFFADRYARIGSFSVFGSQTRIGEAVTVHDWTQFPAFETVRESLTQPTLIHPVLRTPGRIIDRRRAA
jgi:UDP-3-O-[3-hydroxymyristoyl] glucosamine N-acyltransferase